jgi:hypothetical protein
MVVCAVRYERVSDCNSLIGPFYREFFAKYAVLRNSAR